MLRHLCGRQVFRICSYFPAHNAMSTAPVSGSAAAALFVRACEELEVLQSMYGYEDGAFKLQDAATIQEAQSCIGGEVSADWTAPPIRVALTIPVDTGSEERLADIQLLLPPGYPQVSLTVTVQVTGADDSTNSALAAALASKALAAEGEEAVVEMVTELQELVPDIIGSTDKNESTPLPAPHVPSREQSTISTQTSTSVPAKTRQIHTSTRGTQPNAIGPPTVPQSTRATWFDVKPNGNLVLNVRVIPKAKNNAVTGIEDGALKIRITAPPVDGKANAFLVKFLAKRWGVPKSNISVISGESARSKRLRVLQPPTSVIDDLQSFSASLEHETSQSPSTSEQEPAVYEYEKYNKKKGKKGKRLKTKQHSVSDAGAVAGELVFCSFHHLLHGKSHVKEAKMVSAVGCTATSECSRNSQPSVDVCVLWLCCLVFGKAKQLALRGLIIYGTPGVVVLHFPDANDPDVESYLASASRIGKKGQVAMRHPCPAAIAEEVCTRV